MGEHDPELAVYLSRQARGLLMFGGVALALFRETVGDPLPRPRPAGSPFPPWVVVTVAFRGSESSLHFDRRGRDGRSKGSSEAARALAR